ncbi:MAG: transposase [Candidatus Competibacteraceae bacterium]
MLAVLPNRLKATVKEFLESIPAPLKATIQTVCIDMYDGYANAVYEVLPGTTVVVDRFHVAQAYHDSVDQLRKQELKRLQQELPEAEYEPLKGLMWVVRQEPKPIVLQCEGQLYQLIMIFKSVLPDC